MTERDDRLRAGAHLAIDIADARLGAQRAKHRGFVRRAILLDVESGAKAAPCPAQDHHAYLLALGERTKIGVEFVDQPLIESVETLGPVECGNLDLPAGLDEQFPAHSVCPSSTV